MENKQQMAQIYSTGGDYSLSAQENIVHTSDSPENAAAELDRFFVESDYFDYKSVLDPFKYAPDEM